MIGRGFSEADLLRGLFATCSGCRMGDTNHKVNRNLHRSKHVYSTSTATRSVRDPVTTI